MIAPHYIIEDKFDMRGIKDGWTLMNALDMPDFSRFRKYRTADQQLPKKAINFPNTAVFLTKPLKEDTK
jgi:hypothetical protein